VANNRLYLVNKSKDKCILLAKYFPVIAPNTWYIKNPEIMLDSLLEAFGSIEESGQYGVEHPWTLEYEVEKDEL
jgi:hypothetical protein